MYQAYPLAKIVLRRVLVVLIGVLALPVMLLRRIARASTVICTACGAKPAPNQSGWRNRKRQAVSTGNARLR